MSDTPEWEKRVRWAAVRYPPGIDVLGPAPVEEWRAHPEEFLAELPEPCRAAVREQLAIIPSGTSILEAMISILAICPAEFREEAGRQAEEDLESMREL